MYPEILRIGDFVISSYGLMMVIAFLTGNYLLRKDMIKIGKNPEMADDLTFQAALGGVIGAKLYYIIENIPNGRALENISGLFDIFMGLITLNITLVSSGIQNFGSGMVFLGGLIGGTVSVFMYSKTQFNIFKCCRLDISLCYSGSWYRSYWMFFGRR